MDGTNIVKKSRNVQAAFEVENRAKDGDHLQLYS